MKSLCKELGMNQQQMVECLKPLYPSISRAAVSVAERSEDSGVTYTSAAKKAAYRLTGRCEPKPKRRHSLRTTVWFDERQWKFLTRQPGGIGNYIRILVDQEIKRAAAGSGTTDSRTAK